MRKTKSALLFKQGRKGIFKFKVQFIIIIILSFLSVFVLTTSLNLRDRLNRTFNDVVKSVEKFDYYNQDTVYGNGQSSEYQTSQIAVLSAINNQTNISYIDSQKSKYNIAFRSDYYGENFITKSFESQEMKTLFKNSTLSLNASNEIRIESRKIIIINMYEELLDVKSFETALKKFVNKNSINLQEDLKYLKSILSNPIELSKINNWDLFVHASSIAESLMAFWAYNESKYDIKTTTDLYEFMMGTQLDPNKEMDEKLKGTYETKISENQSNKIILEIENTQNETINSVTQKNGLKGISSPIFKDNLNQTYHNDLISDSPFKLQPFGEREDWASKLSGFESRSLPQEIYEEIFKTSSQLESKAQTVGAYDWVLKTKEFDPFRKEPIAYVLNSVYFYNLKIAAVAADVEIETRREFNLFDNISQIKYRAIVLDEQTKFKTWILNEYIGGRIPMNLGEVLVSEQFAKVHKIKVNDNIKVGNGTLTVSGFATDTLSYYPIADEDLPIPQTRTSAVIYATPKTFETIRKDTAVNAGTNISKILIRNFIWKNKNSDLSVLNNLYRTTSPQVLFADSAYKMNWTLQPMVVMIYTVSTMALSLVIMLIAILGLIISTKKTIKQNSKQIGILKSMGYKPLSISISYIAQAVFLTIFVIPLSWVIGLITQSAYINLFVPYFSIEMHQVQVSFGPLIISYLVFGLLSILCSLVVAYNLTRKPVIEIIGQLEEKRSRSWSLDKINNTMLKKAKFTLRFSVNLASTNRNNIVLMTLIVLISSFMVSIGLSIPATVNSVKEGYYRNVNYSNSYDYVKPVSNAPLSKGSVVYSEAPDLLDKDFKQVGEKYVYSNPKYYFESSYDSSPIAKYMYMGSTDSDIKIQNTFKYLTTDQANVKTYETENNPAENSLINIVIEQLGNNFSQSVGQQFSVGTIEQILALVIHSSDGSSGDGVLRSDNELSLKYSKITENLTTAIPLVLSSVLGVQQENSNDWKTSIVQTIIKAAPPFVQSYIQDPSRIEQYTFGYNTKRLVKNEETFATKIKISNDKYDVSLTGLNDKQKAFNIEKDLSEKLFLDDETKKAVQKVFENKQENDIFNNKIKIYDAKSNTILAPIVTNHQSTNTYKLNKKPSLENFVAADTQLLFESDKGDFKVLPKQAWVYDDSDFLNSDYYTKAYKDKNLINQNRTGIYVDFKDQNSYLNLQDLDNNKFTFRNFYDENNKISNFSYLFNDFAKNQEDGISYIRPYYEYRNVKLFLPKSVIKNDIGVGGQNKWANFINKKIANTGADLNEYFNNEVKSNKVPASVKNAWENQYGVSPDSKYIQISPYALEYSMKKEEARNRGLANLTDQKYDYVWYSDAMNAGLLKQAEAPISYLNKDLKVDLLFIGKLDSYNGSLVIVDQTFANLMNNYSIIDKYDLKNDMLSDEIEHKAGDKLSDSKGQTFVNMYDRYKPHDETKDIYVNNWLDTLANGKESLDYTQMMWNNAKFSNIAEPYDLTTGFVTTNNENNGLLLLSQERTGNISTGNLQMMPANQSLLLTEKQLIQQVTGLAISVAMLIIVSVIITSSLLIVLICDIYITKYRMFMILMKSFGYSNWKVMKYSFGPVTILSVLSWIGGTAAAWGLISLSIIGLKALGLSIPLILTAWPIYVSSIIIASVYLSSIMVSSVKVRKQEPSEMLKEANE